MLQSKNANKKLQEPFIPFIDWNQIFLQMSHQKTNPIKTPAKSKFHSMLQSSGQENENSTYSSRFGNSYTYSAQKRKPIFNQSLSRSDIQKSSSVRKKIFTKNQKSQEKSYGVHFSRLLQVEQLKLKTSEDQEDQRLNQYQRNEEDSVVSSSVEQDSGLVDIKRQLFPQTPIKKLVQEGQNLQTGRQFGSCSWRKQLFQDQLSPPRSTVSPKSSISRPQQSLSPPKSIISISTNNIENTAVKFIYKTPSKQTKQNCVIMQKFTTMESSKVNKMNENEQKWPQKNSYKRMKIGQISGQSINNNDQRNSGNRGNLTIVNGGNWGGISKNMIVGNTTDQIIFQRKIKNENSKDIAKALRQLHSRMSKKNKLTDGMEEENKNLRQQNLRLRQQNRILKRNSMQLKKPAYTSQLNQNRGQVTNLRSGEHSNKDQQKQKVTLSREEQRRVTLNENIHLRIKMEKARGMLNSLIQLGAVQGNSINSIINIQATINQVIRQLEV